MLPVRLPLRRARRRLTGPHRPTEAPLTSDYRTTASQNFDPRQAVVHHRREVLEALLARRGSTPPPSGDSIWNWRVLLAESRSPAEFAAVLAEVATGEDGALARVEQLLLGAESCLWEHHDNDRAQRLAALRRQLTEAARAIDELATGMLDQPAPRVRTAAARTRPPVRSAPPSCVSVAQPARAVADPGRPTGVSR